MMSLRRLLATPKQQRALSSTVVLLSICRRRRSMSLVVLLFTLLFVTVCRAHAAAAAATASESTKDGGAFRFPTRKEQLRGFVDDVDGNDVIVNTAFGKLRGKQRLGQPLAGGETSLVNWFLGVPYAKPPTGHLRFKATVACEPWNGTRDAVRFAPICPQHPRSTPLYGHQDEDCLYLNIYSPTAAAQTDRRRSSPGSLYPVMVYIHGGSYRVGTGNVFQGHVLAQYGVVVVSINYRLGMLGFLSARDENLEGNYGLYDQIASLEWIRQNILEFGGDSDRVTIFGNSAGGASVGILAVSPKATGLFHYAIVQSGSPLSFWAVHNDSADLPSFVRSLANNVSCNHNQFADLVACLRRLTYKQLFDSASRMPRITPSGTDLRPVPDGKVVVEMPRRSYASGLFSGRSLMIGIVAGEMTKHMGLLFRRDLVRDTSIDLEFDDGFERDSFERVIRFVICTKFGLDETIADVVLHKYTNWTHDDISDPYENRRQYVNFLTDLAMWTPSIEVASSVVSQSQSPQSAQRPTTFVYTMQLDRESDEGDDWVRNHHQVELVYVFGSPFTGIDVDELTFKDTYTDEDRSISRHMMTLWSNFAKTGNPSLGGSWNGTTSPAAEVVVNWTQFRKSTGDYLRIVSTNATMRRHHRSDFVALWNDLVVRINDRLTTAASHRHRLLSAPAAAERSSHDWSLVTLVVSVVQLTIVCLFLLIFTIKRRFCERGR